ncbi:MAG: TrmH family RNA methyltransferase [Candidatus Hermodarchaeia archaeon]
MQKDLKAGIYGKKARKEGKTPAIALINPKFSHNVGAALRAASCFGAKQVWWTGNRVTLDSKKRLPREERMKGYKDVELRQFDQVYDQFDSDVVPVAIELRKNSESLQSFVHPKKALYVFGPEDGSLSATHLSRCHRFVVIPTRHCVNLAAAVYIILYDRFMKEFPNATIHDMLNEPRNQMRGMFANDDDFHEQLGISSCQGR